MSGWPTQECRYSTPRRARFNLAYVHIAEKNYPAALEVIAEALALDKMGQYRDRLLQKQQEALMLLARRHQKEYLLLINLVSRHSAPQTGEQPIIAGPDQGSGNASV